MKIYVGLRRPLCVCNANQPAFLEEALPGRLGGRRVRWRREAGKRERRGRHRRGEEGVVGPRNGEARRGQVDADGEGGEEEQVGKSKERDGCTGKNGMVKGERDQ